MNRSYSAPLPGDLEGVDEVDDDDDGDWRPLEDAGDNLWVGKDLPP